MGGWGAGGGGESAGGFGAATATGTRAVGAAGGVGVVVGGARAGSVDMTGQGSCAACIGAGDATVGAPVVRMEARAGE